MFKKKKDEPKLSDEGRTGEFHLPPKDEEVVEQLDAQLAKELEAKETGSAALDQAKPTLEGKIDQARRLAEAGFISPAEAKAAIEGHGSKACPTCGNPFPDDKAACAVDGTSQEA